ncbi:uncharacterized protein I303_106132 [Kwoniella dejecticola CBS 10117]|uniref:ferric-chelate reductase (NADPH) n=1 Tax=Kwoniella dejecticola CBS 10117 TaxID=1296121 RepID=A0A1A6A1C7_9TREE|nr:uncharacterized protein I303_06151 [Kwoniella dejecticola CBS 10117]OBR83868.1 hypothetical protein I303_06151 [Kwoniella dejecticola CBS 10117]
MPLMGDPSLASVLYGASVTFDIHAATQTVAAVVPVATGKEVNMTEIVEQQKNDQMGMDSTMPRNLYLAFAGLLVLCMIISHPRFLARLFASLPSSSSSSRSKKNASVRIYPYSQQSLESLQPKREVSGGDLSQGWYLRKGRNSRIEISSPSTTPDTCSKKDPFSSASAFDEKSLSPNTLDSSSSFPSPIYYPPPHIIPLLNHLPFSSTFQFLTPLSILPSHLKSFLTLPQLYLVIGYLVLNGFALIWKSDLSPASKDKGYGSDWMRSGLVATAQIPLTVALGVRGNIIGLCVGKGYERLKVYHKIVGRVVFLASTIHGAAYMYKWTVAGKFSAYAAKPFAMWGLLAYFALVLIVVTSLPWVRKAWHGVFEICHFVGIVGLLVGLALHVAVAVPFCVAAMVIYLISIFCSLTKTRLAHAELQALPGAGTTVVTIPALKTGWRAGQHVRIRIPALGLSKAFESHPFTIASAPNGEGLVLMCKRAGDWTNSLYELAQRSSDFEDRAEGGRNQATIILEGPYGGLGNTLAPSFSSVVLIAGGSGITQSLALAQDLVSRASSGVVRARTIDLIWMVRTEDTAKPLTSTLLGLVNEAKQWEIQCLEGRRRGEKRPNPTALRVKIFVTRCPASSPLNLLPDDQIEEWKIEQDTFTLQANGGLKRQPSAADKAKYEYLCRNPSSSSTSSNWSTSTSSLAKKYNLPLSTISINPLRPNFEILLNSFVDETINTYGKMRVDPSGMLVSACGPEDMIANVRSSIRGMQAEKKVGCGGIEFEDEHFGF